MSSVSIFNHRARLEIVSLANGQRCVVADEVLLEPDRLVSFAAENADSFRSAGFNFYPGLLLSVPQTVASELAAFFNAHVRKHFDARRLERMHCRLSMVTRSPEQLEPVQCLCHRDSPMLNPRSSIQACILYLFRDAALGGTSFYDPARPAEDIDRLFTDAQKLPSEAFFMQYGIERGYIHGSNEWFTQVGRIEARWNRCIFFDGFCFHSGEIPVPDRLSTDPRLGRLTLNGFFTSRRHLK
jgi:hypothetical protein